MPGEKQAPEYFGVVPADAKDESSGPLEERPRRDNVTPKIPDGQQQFISLDVNNEKPSLVDKIDYSMNTIWSLSTDSDGKSMIYTASLTQGKDTSGNPTTTRTLWYLGASDDNKQVEYRELPLKDNEDQRKAVLPYVPWTIDVLTQPTQDTSDVKNADDIVTKPGNVLSAVFGISQNGAKMGRWVNGRTGKLDTVSPAPLTRTQSRAKSTSRIRCCV
ncbi:hypothetical protein BKA63DRAFT_563915 [Paraphoma chrysanthemicola]|nr:hypothetical protein BKA63DRAFT_563915 [Paraphoma chrysanthemicola]